MREFRELPHKEAHILVKGAYPSFILLARVYHVPALVRQAAYVILDPWGLIIGECQHGLSWAVSFKSGCPPAAFYYTGA